MVLFFLKGHNMTDKINFFNHKDAEISALAIARDIKNEDISKWYKTIATRWLRQQADCATPVLPGTKDLPEWAQKDLEEGKSVHHFIISQNAKDKLLNIAHWLQILNRAQKKNENEDLIKEARKVFENLPKTSVDVAHKKANDWYKKEARKSSKDILNKSKNAEAIEILESENDYIWERVSTDGMIAVGQELLNCLRYGYYQGDVKKNEKNIWALRSPEGSYIAALTVDTAKKAIVECKGNNNQPAYDCGKHVYNLMQNLDLKNNTESDLKPLNIVHNVYLPDAKPLDTLSNGNRILWIEFEQNNRFNSFYNNYSNLASDKTEISKNAKLVIVKQENNNYKTIEIMTLTLHKKDLIIENHIFYQDYTNEDYKKIFNHMKEKIKTLGEYNKLNHSQIHHYQINAPHFFKLNKSQTELVYWDNFAEEIMIKNQKFFTVKLYTEEVKTGGMVEKNNITQYYFIDKHEKIHLVFSTIKNNYETKGYIHHKSEKLEEIFNCTALDFLKEIDPKGEIFLPLNNFSTNSYHINSKELKNLKDFIQAPSPHHQTETWPWEIYPTGKGWSHVDNMTEIFDIKDFKNYKIKSTKYKTKIPHQTFAGEEKNEFSYSYDIINAKNNIIAKIFILKNTFLVQGNFEGNTNLATSIINYFDIQNNSVEKNINFTYNVPNFILLKKKKYQPIKQTKTSLEINDGIIIKANRCWFGTKDGVNMLWEMPSPRKKVVSQIKILIEDTNEAVEHLAQASKELGLTFVNNDESFKKAGYTLANGNLISRAMPHIENIEGVNVNFKTGNRTENLPVYWSRATLTKNDLEWELSVQNSENVNNYYHYAHFSRAYVHVDLKGIAYFSFTNDKFIQTEIQIELINKFLEKTGLKPDIFTQIRLNRVFKDGKLQIPDETSLLYTSKEKMLNLEEDIWHIEYNTFKLYAEDNEKLIELTYNKGGIINADFENTTFEIFLEKTSKIKDFLKKFQ